jgi:origin recognition complex subunit 4
MSEDVRSAKRRRIASHHDPPTPSKSANSRARNASAAAGSNKKSNGDGNETPSRRGRPSGAKVMNGVEESPSKRSGSRKASRNISVLVKAPEDDADDEEDELAASDEEESDGEPRRSSRKRKPSAKLQFIVKDKSEMEKPRNETPRPEPKSVVKRKEPTSKIATPAKYAKSTQSTPSQTPKRRGRPPKVPVREEEPEALESRKAPVVLLATPKKRGRPPGSTKKLNEAIKPVPTPKTLRFDLPPAKTNGVPEEPEDMDVDMVDDEVNAEDKTAAAEQHALALKLLNKFGEGEYPSSILSRVVLEKLTQRRPIPLTHLDDEYSKVYTLLESTITAGEGNSMLVVGARGSGKTALVNKALSELTKEQKEYFHVVRLNGFIQTDDKLALREIWRQLGREMEIDEDASKSYADTLTMLLALLSHPDEIAGEAVDRVAKSVIIIMDEFDLFATHARQTLLYNLLDIAQSRKAPIAVLGLTTKFDVTERLEKRVKSRFSHRYVHLPLSKSLKAFQDVCRAALSIQPEDLTFDEQVAITQAVPHTQTKRKKDKIELSDCLEVWNASVTV